MFMDNSVVIMTAKSISGIGFTFKIQKYIYIELEKIFITKCWILLVRIKVISPV